MCNSKTIKICPNHHADLLRFLFKEDSLKIKKVLKLISSPHFTNKKKKKKKKKKIDKKFSFVILHKLT